MHDRGGGSGAPRSLPAGSQPSSLPGGNNVLLILAVFLLVVLAAAALAARAAAPSRRVLGGGRAATPRQRRAAASPHVVVDTLNLAFHLRGRRGVAAGPVTTCTVAETIRSSAPVLRRHFSGDLIYVLKDRSKTPLTATEMAVLAVAAQQSGVTLVVAAAVRPDAKKSTSTKKAWRELGGEAGRSHSKLGRDDFYAGLLAWRRRCGVLTADRMRDFEALRSEVPPFRAHTLGPHKKTTDPAWTRGEHVTPGAVEFSQVRAPARLAYADYGLG